MGRLFRYFLLAMALSVIVPRIFGDGAAAECAPALETVCDQITEAAPPGELHRFVFASLQRDLAPGSSGFCSFVTKTPVSRVSSLFRFCANAVSENRVVSSGPLTRLRFQQRCFDGWLAALQHTGYYVFFLRKIIV